MEIAKCTMLALRVSIFVYAAVGIALIVFGCVLENPPKHYASAMFVAVGALNLFASLAGFWGSYNRKRVLLVFISFGGLSLLLQIIFEITLMTDFSSVAGAITGAQSVDQTNTNLNVMRWVALGFIFFELLTLILAALLKWVIKGDGGYTGFDDEQHEARMLNLGNLRSDVESSGQTKGYSKIRETMALKYGSVTSGIGDWRSKVKLSFM